MAGETRRARGTSEDGRAGRRVDASLEPKPVEPQAAPPAVDDFAVDANELVRRFAAGEGADLNGLIQRSLADRRAA